ncbi:hypothetical protein [Herbiconiux liangxiaofengii]|uniref:hypothetical protein n=1 Tax=Herbiconiux liangxiaofengii TaxID=3342795 RepID=UPI0035B8C871
MKKPIALLVSIAILPCLMGAATQPPPDASSTGQVDLEADIDGAGATVVDPAVYDSETVVVVDESGSAIEQSSGDTGAGSASDAGLSGCDYRNAVFTNLSGWQDSVDGCGIIGFDWSARYSYSWSQDTFAWNSGPSCVQGRGYSTNRTVSTPVWSNAGCGSKGTVSAFIGNRATVAKIRGHVNAVAKIGYVRWK